MGGKVKFKQQTNKIYPDHAPIVALRMGLFLQKFSWDGWFTRDCITDGAIFAGSTYYLFNTTNFFSSRPYANDLDILMPIKDRKDIEDRVEDFSRGLFEITDMKRHGLNTSYQAKFNDDRFIRNNDLLFQIDFLFREFENIGESLRKRPTEFTKFANGVDSIDFYNGLSGAPHKILISSLTAATDEVYCWSNVYGLRTRVDDPPVYITDLDDTFIRLFNVKDVPVYYYSFHGLVHLIRKQLNEEQQRKVFEKFTKKCKEMGHESVFKNRSYCDWSIHLCYEGTPETSGQAV